MKTGYLLYKLISLSVLFTYVYTVYAFIKEFYWKVISSLYIVPEYIYIIYILLLNIS